MEQHDQHSPGQGHDHGHGHGHEHGHGHGHVEFTEDEWERWAADAEREGEVLLGFVTDAISSVAKLNRAAPGRIVDVGAGPGVAACELARLFPDAEVIAVDSSAAMRERAGRRVEAHGLQRRVQVVAGELPHDLKLPGAADLVWASMSLHHVGDEVAALRSLRDVLSPHGVLVIIEMADPVHMLPTDSQLGRPGLNERVDRVAADWFRRMRHSLPGAVESRDFSEMVTDAGFQLLEDRVSRLRLEAPLSADGAAFAQLTLQRTCRQLDSHLDTDDRAVLESILDPAHPLSFERRTDAFIEASRRVVIVSH